MIYELWHGDGSTTCCRACPNGHKPGCLHACLEQENAVFQVAYIAVTPIHAMQIHYEIMGWGDYRPMLDESGKIYPEDDQPFPSDIIGQTHKEPETTIYGHWLKRKFPWRV